MNALYLQLFPKPMLIDPLGHGEQDAHREKPILRLACPEAFASDLGGQFRFWKINPKQYKIPQVRKEIKKRTGGNKEDSQVEIEHIPLDQYVDKLICAHVERLKKDAAEIFEPVERYRNRQRQLSELTRIQAKQLELKEQIQDLKRWLKECRKKRKAQEVLSEEEEQGEQEDEDEQEEEEQGEQEEQGEGEDEV